MGKKLYYRGAGKWPEFVIRGDKIDGPIPSTSVASWKDFQKVVTSEKLKAGEFIFRGQRRNDWGLIPSIARQAKGETVDGKLAKTTLDSFRLASRGRLSNDRYIEDDDDELWAQGQHNELKTPLLDWTCSPYIALFFAFEPDDRREGTDSRVVFALNRRWISEVADAALKDGVSKKESVVRIFQPRSGSNSRLLSQAGLFTKSPYEETIASWIITHSDDLADDAEALSDVIFKIHIPNKEREECLRHLNYMNINNASLFPDLTGASRHTNYQIQAYPPAQPPDLLPEIRASERLFRLFSPDMEKVRESYMLRKNCSAVDIQTMLAKDWAERDGDFIRITALGQGEIRKRIQSSKRPPTQ